MDNDRIIVWNIMMVNKTQYIREGKTDGEVRAVFQEIAKQKKHMKNIRSVK
jgi:hypothetical protein